MFVDNMMFFLSVSFFYNFICLGCVKNFIISPQSSAALVLVSDLLRQ